MNSALSAFSLMSCAPAPWPAWRSSTEFASVCQCLACTEECRKRLITPDMVSQVLNRHKWSPPLIYLPHSWLMQSSMQLAFFSARAHYCLLPACCPLEHSSSSSTKLLSNLPSAVIAAWWHYTPDARTCICFYWTSWGSSQFISPACLGSFEEQPCPLAYWSLIPDKCHL